MKNFNKKYWRALSIILLCVLTNSNIQTSSATVQTKSTEPVVASDIYDQQVTNLVIYNDCSNTPSRDSILPELLNALLENQLIITTKNSFHRLLFEHSNLKKDKTLLRRYNALDWLTQKHNKNGIFNPKAILSTLDQYLSNIEKNINLATYVIYEDFIAQDAYICREIDAEHIIFIPKRLLTDNRTNAARKKLAKIAPGAEKSFKSLGVSIEDCSLGLYVSSLKSFNYKKPTFCNQDPTCLAPCGTISLVNTFSALAIKPRLSPHIPLDLLNIFLPKMNIFLVGHGIFDNSITGAIIADLSCNAELAAKSEFEQLLQLFNTRYLIQCLTILSCYMGLQMDTFMNDFTKRTFFENLSYPILFSAGLATGALSLKPRIALNADVYNSNRKRLANPEKVTDDKGPFTLFFDYLNHTQTHHVAASKIQPAYSYTAYKPEYSKAIDAMMHLFNNQEIYFLNNLTLIHFPRTSWISTVELDKRIKTITPIQGVTAQKGITIPSSVSLVLLSTSYVKYPIYIANRDTNAPPLWIVPTIINQQQIDLFEDYYIEEIHYPYELINLGKSFCNEVFIGTSGLDFRVLIKKVQCKASDNEINSIAEYKDVLVWYHINPENDDHLAVMIYKKQIDGAQPWIIEKTLYQITKGLLAHSADIESLKVLSATDLQMYEKCVNNGIATVPTPQLVDDSMSQEEPKIASPKKFEVIDYYEKSVEEMTENLETALGKITKRSLADAQKEQAYRKQKAEAENQSQAQPTQGQMAQAQT